MSDASKRKKKAKPLGHSRRKIIRLDPKRIKESQDCKWEKELYDFLSLLSGRDFEVAEKLINLMARRPTKRTTLLIIMQN